MQRKEDPHFGGRGQGGGAYWGSVIGRALQEAIARLLRAELSFHVRVRGVDNLACERYIVNDIMDGGFDIAYLELFDLPDRRPADFVWTAISDYIGPYVKPLERFLVEVRPDLVVSLQYPLEPPETIPIIPRLGRLPNLVAQCESHGCKVVYLPWVNAVNIETYNLDKQYAGMCTGKMSESYPFRIAICQYLEKLHRTDIIISTSKTNEFALSDEDYHRCLASTRYYFTGGVYDLQIPPKVYEVMNYGACLVCNPMPMAEASGLIPGETYLPIESIDEIPVILERDDWREIAPKGQAMVHERHSIQARARDFVKVYREITGKDE